MEKGNSVRPGRMSPASGQQTTQGEDSGNQQSGAQQQAGGHHQPSYMDIRGLRQSQVTTQRSRSDLHGNPPHPPAISETEIEKPASLRDDDSYHSSSSSSQASRVGRRPGSNGTEHRLKIMRSVSEVRDGIESRRELELGEPLEKHPTPRNLADENLVTWDVEDAENPKTWAFGRKWAAVGIVSMFTLISPVSSSMTAPALNAIGAELDMTSEFQKELSLSIFVLGMCLDHLFVTCMFTALIAFLAYAIGTDLSHRGWHCRQIWETLPTNISSQVPWF